MGKNKEYELAIKIAGEVEKSFYESMNLSKKELQDIARQAAQTVTRMEAITGQSAETSLRIKESFSKGIKDAEPLFSGLESATKTAFDGMTKAAMLAGAGITAGLTASVHVGSEFESAFAGVKKTVNASNAELAQMRSEIRGLAKDELPATAAELSAIAESAGQLGIHNGNIMGFTRTMADLDVATDLGDGAAADFAKFANITGMDQGLFSNMGSSVVALGNNMATQESNIVDMSMRIAAAGNQIGLSEANILGYSAALSSVGIEAEAGGTAFSKLLTNLQMATETGKNLEAYASVAGKTGQEFKQAFQEDATEAINAFLIGLTDTEQNGKSAIAVLDEMGLTEVRLRDTLLRAGNASELFVDALEISNTAWKENTALANEAAQRYQTFESQCQMTQNKLSDIGITLYDDLRPALTEGIGLANEFVDNFAGRIESEMPTLIRETKEAAIAFGNFADPFLQVGGWLVDNPGVIVGTIAGVGGALTTYKIASGISSLTKALKAFNPVGMSFMAFGAAAGVIAGVSTAIKKAEIEAKQANLAAHFGDISLSVAELQETAAAMLNSQNLDRLNESIAAMGEVDAIAGDIRDAKRELDKMNWKVSVGMELTEDEQERYQMEVENFVASTQDLLLQDQYALSLSVKVLFGDDEENAEEVTRQINEFYNGKQKELETEKAKMAEMLSKAREDGTISPEETREMAAQQEVISQIQRSLLGDEYETDLEVIKAKYQGGNLNADSAINLSAELTEQRQAYNSGLDEEYANLVQHYMGMYEGKELDSHIEDARKALLQRKADSLISSTRINLANYQDSYGEEYEELINNARMQAGEQLERSLRGVAYYGEANAHLSWLGESVIDDIGVDKSTRDAWADLYAPMKTTIQEFQELQQQLEEMGMEIPAEMKELMAEISSFGVVAGNEDAAWGLLGNLAESEEYQEYLKTIAEAGGYMPEEFANAILDNQAVINDAVNQSYGMTQEMIDYTYGQGFDVTAPINVAMVSKGINIGMDAIPHANGGIFDKPHLGLIAEAGYPESVIPINRSPEAIELWLQTGELLGMDGLTGGSYPLAADIEEAAYSGAGEMIVSIEHNPTLQFYGGTPAKEDIEDALESDEEEFDRKMQDWLARNRRLKFTDMFG